MKVKGVHFGQTNISLRKKTVPKSTSVNSPIVEKTLIHSTGPEHNQWGHHRDSERFYSLSKGFRSRKNFRIPMQSCRFFSPDLFMKISKFSKTVHTIFIKSCTVILPPACAKASKSYDWNVRNIAKINPKMAKISPIQPFIDFFQFSQKLSIRVKRNFAELLYTILWSFVCNFIKFVWLRCEKHSQNSPKNCQKQSFFDFFRFSQNLSVRFERSFVQSFYTILWSLCVFSSNSYGWDVRNRAKINPKMAKKQLLFDFFRFFAKTVHTIRTKISTVILYTIVWSYMCNFNNFVRYSKTENWR